MDEVTKKIVLSDDATSDKNNQSHKSNVPRTHQKIKRLKRYS